MLRDYQIKAIEMVRARIRERPLLCLPTGAGKTSVAAEIIRLATKRGKRSVFLVHRRELVDQAVDRLAQFGVEAGRILAGHPERRELPVQVASIPSLLRRDHWPASVVIVDEAAHAVSASWAKCLARYEGAFVLGLTATPIRLDGKGLGDLFGCIIEPVSTRELIRQGFLIEPRVFAPPIDLSKIHVVRGDYAIPELAEKMTKLVGSITGTWKERALGMKTVAFAVNVEHSLAIVEAFGDRARHLDYTMSHKDRAGILAALREGSIDIVSQVQLLSEGWDLPALQCAILARPTKSLALFRQMVGRVMRPPGPVLVLDHAGNHHEHGVVTEPMAWSLTTIDRKQKAQSVRTCPKCFAVVPANITICPVCGAALVATREDADVPKVENPGELTEFRAKPSATAREAAYRALVTEASQRRRKLGWARNQYRERFGVWPRFGPIERALYRCAGHVWEVKPFGTRCRICYAQPSSSVLT